MLASILVLTTIFVYCSIVFNKSEQDQYPLIIVDGKKAPRLSPLSFHINKLDSECMICHVNTQIFSVDHETFQPIKMPHEFRENFISCHILET